MRRETVMTGLICLNLGLLAGMAYVWKNRGASPPVVETPPANPTTADPAFKTITRRVHPPAKGSSDPSRFSWGMIESSDFKEYIANLRAVGCPEQTIQDIIVAEVNKLYAGKEAALRLRPEHLKPWEVFAVPTRATLERERKLRRLLREKRDLLEELLGIYVPVEMPPSSTNPTRRDESRFEQAFANLPEGKRDAVRAIQERYWEGLEDLEARTMNFWETQDLEEARRIRAELRNSLAQTLTSDELLDYDIATSSNAQRYRTELAAVNLSDKEFRELYRLRRDFDEALNFQGDPNDPEMARKRADARRLLQETLRSTLGEERYATYERSRDYYFRNLNSLAQENGLPADAAVKAYDLHRLAMQESARVRSNPDLTPEQREQALRQMQGELEAAMGQVLGKEAFNRFQQTGGGRIYVDGAPGSVRTSPSPRPTVQPGTVILAP